MKVRTFYGDNMSAVLTKIRYEVGEEAVILESLEHPTHGYEIKVGVDNSRELKAQEGHTRRIMKEQGYTRKASEMIVRGSGSQSGLIESISHDLTFESQLPFKSKVVALVGPTGVGKTTTIAKLAAQFRVACDLTIGFISLDTYRIGAAHQLQTYATLLHIPCRILDGEKPLEEEFTNALHGLRKCDLIFIDTAGCSPRDKERLHRLSQQMKSLAQMERMLVLAAPMNEYDLRMAAESFDQVGYDRVILSKLDETGFMAPIVNTAIRLQKPLAFFTTGQRVPEDIEPASAKRLSWFMERKMH